MNGESQRQARFCTVIALIFDEVEYLFEGEVLGEILCAETGAEGFGYDPIFKPYIRICLLHRCRLMRRIK